MSVPKKRRTSGSKGKRRSHYNVTAANSQACPKCGTAKLPHRACAKCGSYKGKEVVKIKSSLDKKKK